MAHALADDQYGIASPLGQGPVLEIRNLSVEYVLESGIVCAVDNVSFDVAPGEFLAIVGESGCGKSTLLFGIAQLLNPPAEISGGSVAFKGSNLVELTEHDLAAVRWKDMSVVMQSAMNALNPVTSVGRPVQGRHARPRRDVQGGDRPALGRGAQDGGHRPGPPQELSAPALRRHAATVDDRDGDAVHPRSDHHGRAHVGARRGGAALADGADQGPAAGVPFRRHLRHARHVARQVLLRPADGHVRGSGIGGRFDSAALRPPASPLHRRPHGRVPFDPGAAGAS